MPEESFVTLQYQGGIPTADNTFHTTALLEGRKITFYQEKTSCGVPEAAAEKCKGCLSRRIGSLTHTDGSDFPFTPEQSLKELRWCCHQAHSSYSPHIASLSNLPPV